MSELRKSVDGQVASRALADINFQLTGFGPKASTVKNSASLEELFAKHVSGINIRQAYENSSKLLNEIISKADYDAALRYYNCKGIPSFVASAFGMKESAYCTMILGLVRADRIGPLAEELRAQIS